MVPSVKSLSFPLVFAHVDDPIWLHHGTYITRFFPRERNEAGFRKLKSLERERAIVGQSKWFLKNQRGRRRSFSQAEDGNGCRRSRH